MNGVALASKRVIGRVLGHEVLGQVIGRALRERVRSRGILIDTSSSWVSGEVKAALAFGMYESAESRFVERYLRSDLDTVEFGSSLGFVSCLIRRRLTASARLFCVEANPHLLPVWRTNLELNAPGASASVLNAALDESGARHVPLSIGRDNLGSRVGGSPGQTVNVRAIGLREMLEEHAIGDYAMVCDVEGSEAGFIFGDTAPLARCQQLLIELHVTSWAGRKVSIQDLASALSQRHGMRLVDQYGRVFVFQR